MAVEVGDGECERFLLDGYAELRGVEADGCVRGIWRDAGRRCARGRQNGPGGIFREIACWPDAHADYVVTECGDLHNGAAGAELKTVGERPGSGDPVEPDKTRGLGGLAGGLRL